MVPALIVLLLIFSFVLIKSADLVIISLRHLSPRKKAGLFALSAIILALGTSFPELFISITSALEGESSLTLGLVLGSNIANITLVAGFSALVSGKVEVHGDFLKRDVLIAFIAGILPIFLILDGNLNRVDGLILLAVYGAYAASFFRTRFIQVGHQHRKTSFFYRFIRQFNHVDSKRAKELGRLLVGVAVLLFAADIIVRVSSALAVELNIPVFIIGLIVIAIGTSLPELAFSLRSLGKREPQMFFGNLLGSTIANSTLIIGVAGVISPVEIGGVRNYIVSAITFVIVYLAFWYFIRTKQRLDRWEAVVLLLLYLIFVVVVFFQ